MTDKLQTRPLVREGAPYGQDCMYVCMYVCIRGGLLQPLHLDPQWSIVLNPYDR
jgi:hypothetical protein